MLLLVMSPIVDQENRKVKSVAAACTGGSKHQVEQASKRPLVKHPGESLTIFGKHPAPGLNAAAHTSMVRGQQIRKAGWV